MLRHFLYSLNNETKICHKKIGYILAMNISFSTNNYANKRK